MNVKLLKVALPALLVAAVSTADARKFEGFHVGADLLYKAETQELRDKNTNVEIDHFKPSALGLSLNAGYTEMVGTMYLGGDVQVGHGFGKNEKNYTGRPLGATADISVKLKVTQKMNAGFGGIVGMDFMDDCMAYFRLGLDYSQYESSAYVTAAAGGVTAGDKGTKKYGVWHVVPGVGVKWKLDHDWSVTGRYDYGHQISKDKTFGDVESHKGHFHGIRLGVSYSL